MTEATVPCLWGTVHFIVSRRKWKIDLTTWDPSPTRNKAPTLTWGHPYPDNEQSLRLFDFSWCQTRVQILQYKQKLSEPSSLKILFRGKMLTDKLNPLKTLRSSFLAVLYLLNMINLNLIIVEYNSKYRLYKIKSKLTDQF